MEKKVPKIWEKIVTRIYGSTIQVLIQDLKKTDKGYRYKGVIRWFDDNSEFKDWNKWKKSMLHDVAIEWYMDEYGNWWD